MSTEKITLIDNCEVFPNEQDTVDVLNTFFCNILTNLKIPGYADYDSTANNISDPILKIILRYKNHPTTTFIIFWEFLMF